MANQTNSSILKHRGTIYTIKDLENTPIKKTSQELKIIEARTKGISVNEMTEDDLRYLSDQIIVRGSALYGCEVPQSEFFATALSKEISSHLLDFGYDNLTLGEVILALKMNIEGDFVNPLGEDIKQVAFWGNFIHVSFLVRVLKGYMILRNNLETKFKNHIDGY